MTFVYTEIIWFKELNPNKSGTVFLLQKSYKSDPELALNVQLNPPN